MCFCFATPALEYRIEAHDKCLLNFRNQSILLADFYLSLDSANKEFSFPISLMALRTSFLFLFFLLSFHLPSLSLTLLFPFLFTFTSCTHVPRSDRKNPELGHLRLKVYLLLTAELTPACSQACNQPLRSLIQPSF